MENTANMANVGKALRDLRGIRTRRGVARELDISYSALCNYENGIRIPPDAVKVRIARYYGVSVQDIFYTH